MAFQQLQHGIYCIDSGYIQDHFAAIYLVQEDNEVAIVETGTVHSIPRVLDVMSQLGITHDQVKYVIPTHIHLDHAGGAGGMMAIFEQARLIIHPRGFRHMVDPSRLVAGTIAVYGEAVFSRLYGEIKPVDEPRIDIANDGDIFWLNDRRLKFIDSPGHARHHFCIYDESTKGIFSGDTFGISYPIFKNHADGLLPSTTPIQFDPDALKNSIDKLLQYRPEHLYLTHYGQINQPEAKSDSFKRWIDDFVDLCKQVNPVDEASTKQLEKELQNLIVNKLTDGVDCSQSELLSQLATDLKLNAQGLAVWWQSKNNV